MCGEIGEILITVGVRVRRDHTRGAHSGEYKTNTPDGRSAQVSVWYNDCYKVSGIQTYRIRSRISVSPATLGSRPRRVSAPAFVAWHRGTPCHLGSD